VAAGFLVSVDSHRRPIEAASCTADSAGLTPITFDQPDHLGWTRRTGQLGADVVGRHGAGRVVVILQRQRTPHDRREADRVSLSIESAFMAAAGQGSLSALHRSWRTS
jgi:hypothetical protein